MVRTMVSLTLLLMVTNVLVADDGAVRVISPTRPLFGKLLSIGADGSFVVENGGLVRWSADGKMTKLETPRIFGKILSVDDRNNILSMIGSELYVHSCDKHDKGREIKLKEPHIFGTPFAATLQGDLFTLNGRSVLWYRPSGKVFQSVQGSVPIFGKPFHADTRGNIYVINGGEVYRYTRSYEPTKLFGD